MKVPPMPLTKQKPSILDEYLAGSRSFYSKLQESQEETNVEILTRQWKYHGQPLSFAGYEYQIEPINLDHPRMVFLKPSQVGGSTVVEMKVFLKLDRYGYEGYQYRDLITGQRRYRYFTVLYTMESLEKVQEFATTRFSNFVLDNPFLGLALRQGKSDSKRLKRFRRAVLKMGSRTNVGSVRSTSVDLLVLDELSANLTASTPDLSKNEGEIFSRLQGSEFMVTPWSKGMVIALSSPTNVGDEIQMWYERGDQRVWIVQCYRCEDDPSACDDEIRGYHDPETGYGWQVITYGPHSIQHFYEKGMTRPRELAVYQCKFCKQPLDWSTIGRWAKESPNTYHRCRWLPLKPENADPETGYGVVSYRFPFATAHRTAAQLLEERDNPKASTVFLYNNLLGFNYTDASMTLEEDDLKQDERAAWHTHAHEGDIYVMGIDLHGRRGTYCVVLRLVPGTKSATNPAGIWALCALEKLPTDKTFDRVHDEVVIPGQIRALIDRYQIRVFVSDSEPHSTDVLKLVQSCPLKGYRNKSVAVFKDNFAVLDWDESTYPRRWEGYIREAKVWAIDQVLDRIRAGYLIFPIAHHDTPHPHWREFTLSLTSLYKQVQSNINASIKVTTEQYVAKNATLLDLDHFLSALKFADQAAMLYMQRHAQLSYVPGLTVETFRAEV